MDSTQWRFQKMGTLFQHLTGIKNFVRRAILRIMSLSDLTASIPDYDFMGEDIEAIIIMLLVYGGKPDEFKQNEHLLLYVLKNWKERQLTPDQITDLINLTIVRRADTIQECNIVVDEETINSFRNYLLQEYGKL